MARIPEEILEDIRNRANIVDVVGTYVQLKQRGNDHWGCCPFHKEKTPSFKVSAESQNYYCFGCKVSGNVFGFIQEVENTDFPSAARLLAQRFGVIIPETEADTPEDREAARKKREMRENGYVFLEQVAVWYRTQFAGAEGTGARSYLANRGLDAQTIRQFGLGFSPDSRDACMQWADEQKVPMELLVATGMVNWRDETPDNKYDRFRGRLMFPIHDEMGRVVGFSARILDKDSKWAKYLNTPETDLFHKSRVLYGLHLARVGIKELGAALVCEGQLDVIACHRAGLVNAVCAQGTAFTPDHAKLLRRSTQNVILAFDADSAGRKASLRTIVICHQAGMTVKVVPLPDGQDPDSLFQQGGGALLKETIAAGLDAIHFAFDMACLEHSVDTPAGKDAIVRATIEIIVTLQSPVMHAAYCQWLAEKTNLPEGAVLEMLRAVGNAQASGGGKRQMQSMGRPGGWLRHRSYGGSNYGAARKFDPRRGNDRYGKRDRSRWDITPPPPKPLNRPPLEEIALGDLLALAAAYECATTEMLERLTADLLPNTPKGRALNTLLGYAEEEQWERREQLMAESGDDEAVEAYRQTVDDARFSSLTPRSGAKGDEYERAIERIHEAVRECVGKLVRQAQQNDIRSIMRELAEETDPERAKDLMRKMMALKKPPPDTPDTTD
ncbi:MAG: DNA primase, partial [Lentisphaeria bacterium]|nr:DNA primase [Lentisphaeria bacterium]